MGELTFARAKEAQANAEGARAPWGESGKVSREALKAEVAAR